MLAPLFLLAASAIDPQLARQYFAEAEALCKKDNGTLWGISLCGPLIFAHPATRAVVANQSDKEGRLRDEQGVFTGQLPKELGIANTALDWAGRRWTMVQWPLPQDAISRAGLLMHESFHRVQPELKLKPEQAENAHLDSPEGRLLLQLEWRALARALGATGAERKSAIADALLFRSRRHGQFPTAEAEERTLETNEGLAEYTGARLSGTPAVRLQAAVESARTASTLVRSFAYTSGPLYGYLLDELNPAWRKHAGINPGLLLQQAAGIERLPPNPSGDYGEVALAAWESERNRAREETLAKYRALLIEGPRLQAPNVKWSFTFSPASLVPISGHGTVYPALRMTDVWGILEVTGGALMRSDWKQLSVGAPESTSGRSLKGPGWTLELSDGWHVQAVPGSKDFEITRAAMP